MLAAALPRQRPLRVPMKPTDRGSRLQRGHDHEAAAASVARAREASDRHSPCQDRTHASHSNGRTRMAAAEAHVVVAVLLLALLRLVRVAKVDRAADTLCTPKSSRLCQRRLAKVGAQAVVL